MPLFFGCPLPYWAQGVRALHQGRSGELHKRDREKEKKAILTYLAQQQGNLASRGSSFCEGVETQRDNLLMDNLFMALSAATYELCTSNPEPCLKWGYIGGRMKVMWDVVIFSCLGLRRKNHSDLLVFWGKVLAAFLQSSKGPESINEP